MTRVQDADGMPELADLGHVSATIFARSFLANPEPDGPELPGFAVYHVPKRQFCSAYGQQAGELSDPARGSYRLAPPVVPRGEPDQLSPTGIQVLSAC